MARGHLRISFQRGRGATSNCPPRQCPCCVGSEGGGLLLEGWPPPSLNLHPVGKVKGRGSLSAWSWQQSPLLRNQKKGNASRTGAALFGRWYIGEFLCLPL